MRITHFLLRLVFFEILVNRWSLRRARWVMTSAFKRAFDHFFGECVHWGWEDSWYETLQWISGAGKSYKYRNRCRLWTVRVPRVRETAAEGVYLVYYYYVLWRRSIWSYFICNLVTLWSYEPRNLWFGHICFLSAFLRFYRVNFGILLNYCKFTMPNYFFVYSKKDFLFKLSSSVQVFWVYSFEEG